MKKFIYSLIIPLLFISFENINAQGFSYTPLGSSFSPGSVHSWILYRSFKYRQLSETILRHLNFRFARIVNDLPTGWETQMCYDLCYAPFIDTISLPGDPPYSIASEPSGYNVLYRFSCNWKRFGNFHCQNV